MKARSRSFVVLLTCGGTAVGCAGDTNRSTGAQVGGVVTYRHQVQLPPAAQLVVTLADVTPAEAVILAEDTVHQVGESHIAFALSYDSTAIDTSHVYAIAARIVVGVDVLFASPASYEVLTHGNPLRVQIPVEPASIMGPLPPRAADIAARLSELERVDGSSLEGEAASAISAYFEEGALRYLEERMTIGEFGSAANAYYFDEGALFYHETIRRMGSASARSEGEEVAFRVLFGPDGTLLASSKWINGEPVELEQSELRTSLRHAAALREAAIRLAADPP